MKTLYLIIVFSILNLVTYSQTYYRQSNETAEDFLKRVLFVDELAHPAIETKEWDSTRKVLFGFIDATITSNISDARPDPERDVIGYVFIPTGDNYYQKELIDTFEEDGGLAHIEAVFFANADKDNAREIAVTVSWRQMHRGASIDGYMYDTYLYDNPDLNLPADKLKRLNNFENKFFCEEGSFAGNVKKAKYKNVSLIRAALKQMGY